VTGPQRPGGLGGPPRPAVTVRVADRADLDGLFDLLVAVAGEGRWIGTEAPVDVERRRRRMLEDIQGQEAVVLVAEAGGEPVGQLDLHLARYGVADLGMLVAAAWRGRGVGTALLRAGIDQARGAGAHKVALQVWPHNTAALALYEKFGFRREGQLRRHYRRSSGELWDSIVMGLPLD
jgi:RimJ/RimL family protein N-acetyltransferase